MRFPGWTVVASIVLAAVVTAWLSGRQVEAQKGDQILSGCSIPKSWGRLVTVTNSLVFQTTAGGNQAPVSLAGQAVFEGADGTVRWVPMIFVPNQIISAAGKVPQPRFECALGHVWQRH